jgi:hypothetical protein
MQDKRERLFRAKIAVALQDEYKRVPTEEEINSVFHLTRVMYKAVLGLHYRRLEQRRTDSSRFSDYNYADWLRPHLNP